LLLCYGEGTPDDHAPRTTPQHRSIFRGTRNGRGGTTTSPAFSTLGLLDRPTWHDRHTLVTLAVLGPESTVDKVRVACTRLGADEVARLADAVA
jgi:hypothetical protein